MNNYLTYDCALCTRTVFPRQARIALTQITELPTQRTLWGPYPLHNHCRDRAFPGALDDREVQVLDLPADDPHTHNLLTTADSTPPALTGPDRLLPQQLAAFLGHSPRTTAAHIWPHPDRPLNTPWPPMNQPLPLDGGRLIALAVDPGTTSADAGLHIAHHNAARNHPVLLCTATTRAPHHPPAQLTVDTRADLTTGHLTSYLHRRLPPALIVIDPFQHMLSAAQQRPEYHDDPVDDPGADHPTNTITRELKHLVRRNDLGPPTVLLIAHTERPHPPGALTISDLGTAADLEHHCDVLAALLDTGTDTARLTFLTPHHHPDANITW